jgi:hypothetical protein
MHFIHRNTQTHVYADDMQCTLKFVSVYIFCVSFQVSASCPGGRQSLGRSPTSFLFAWSAGLARCSAAEPPSSTTNGPSLPLTALLSKYINNGQLCISPEFCHHHHHQPINVPTAGAQAFHMDFFFLFFFSYPPDNDYYQRLLLLHFNLITFHTSSRVYATIHAAYYLSFILPTRGVGLPPLVDLFRIHTDSTF